MRYLPTQFFEIEGKREKQNIIESKNSNQPLILPKYSTFESWDCHDCRLKLIYADAWEMRLT